MRMYPRTFPASRRKRPKRRAERRVYEALAGAARQGFVYYEWRRGYERIELDFAIWIAGLGRFALQVKGGHYQLIDGEWHLKTRNGIRPVDTSPLDEAWLAALDLHDDIAERGRTHYNPYVVPVLAFPDMERDDAITHLAGRKGVYLIWGAASLLADLEAIVHDRSVSDPLPWERIAREVHAVTDGLVRFDLAESPEANGIAKETTARSNDRSRGEMRVLVGGRNIITIRYGATRSRWRREREP